MGTFNARRGRSACAALEDRRSDPSASDSDDAQATLNEHDDIEVFITAKEGDDFYKSKEGRLKLYVEPKETDDDRPALVETVPFRVLGFSRDGWAAIVFGGTRYYVKSSDIVKTDVPDDAPEYVAPEDSQGIRFFAPVEGDGEEYVATMNTVAFSLPDGSKTVVADTRCCRSLPR